jgi:hypothetical protein
VTSASRLSSRPTPTTPPVGPWPADTDTATRGAVPGAPWGDGSDPPPAVDPADPEDGGDGLARPGEPAASDSLGEEADLADEEEAPSRADDPVADAAEPARARVSLDPGIRETDPGCEGSAPAAASVGAAVASLWAAVPDAAPESAAGPLGAAVSARPRPG